MPAHAPIRTRWFCLLTALLATGLVASSAARAESMRQRLLSANEVLAARTDGVVLELYALDARLESVRARVASLRAQADELEQRRRDARFRLALVRRTLVEAEARLGERLRELYSQGDVDPLAVLLGAQTLDEAVSTLESLDSFATQDAALVDRVDRARRDVARAVHALAAREREVRELARQAAGAEASLLAARSERRAYLTRLLAERRLNAAQLARLATRAHEAQEKADEIQVSATSSSSPSSSSQESGGGSPPPPPAPAVGPGTRMTVSSTGYCLKGTTSTGVPVGWGIVAVDPSIIPLGTRMTIPGYGEGVAADTGSTVHGSHIDLWFPTCAQASAWGRRTVTITLH
ncbi:MAG: 3D domain-containing protein [Actinomycetota bacterium]|nr:3D domain-containing protein [Actinomycetota bacterium]